MLGIELWLVVLLRLGVLTGERVAFHGLGREKNGLATTAVAYGGSAVVLWIAALWLEHGHWVGQAFWPGAVYAVSFALYTASLAAGPVSLVSAFANATTIILFFITPTTSLVAWFAVGLFALGSFLLMPLRERLAPAVLWMLLSDGALALGRLMDSHNTGLASFSYAASLFTSVGLWLIIPLTLYGLWGEIFALMRQRPHWSLAASVTNAVAYLTVLELLRHMPATLVEAISAWAGVFATIAGVWWFHESQARRKIGAATLMTIGTIILIFSQHGR